METIIWYKNKEGLFFITKAEKIFLISFLLFVLSLFILLWVPFPTYNYYIGIKEQNNIIISLSKRQFPLLQESTLYIKEKKYNFQIIKKEAIEGNSYLVTLQLKEQINIKHNTFEIVIKGKKKSKIDEFIKKIRKEWSLSPN